MALCAAPLAAQSDSTLYVGTYTNNGSKGIYSYRFDAASGKLTPIGVTESSNPAFLAVHPNGKYLYAANENGKGTVSAFGIDAASGNLKPLNRVGSGGGGPCHIAVDNAGKWLFAANYGSGSAAACPIHADGALGEPAATFQHAGKGPVTDRQEGPHTHEAAVSADNRFVLFADLGIDEVLSYKIDPVKGMAPNNPPFVKLKPGTGPRHMVYSADAKFVYVLGELGGTVTVFAYDSAKGALHEIQTISTEPAGYKGPASTAEIALHPNARFLYASNRGDNTIAIYKVDPAKGTLTAAGWASSGGKKPRVFAIHPAGKFLLAANQDTDQIVVFRIDPQTGGLTPTGQKVDVIQPVSLVFVRR